MRLEHPDAPLCVLVSRSSTPFRAVLHRGDAANLDRDPARVAETLDDCPVIDDLVRELERAAAS